MPACGYEFYLLVRSLVRYRVEHSKIKFLSTRGHVIPSIYLSLYLTDVRAKIFQSIDFFNFLPQSDNELLVPELQKKRGSPSPFQR